MYKSRITTYVLVMFMAMSFTSCINIIERIAFNKDGSGTYSVTIDMGQVVNMLKMMGGDDLGDEGSMLDSLQSGFDVFKDRFEAIEGISNARLEVDQESFNITTHYDFADIDALNRALSQYYKVDDEPVESKIFFTLEKKTLVRLDESAFADAMGEQLKSQGLNFDPSMLFGDMFYESILVFPKRAKLLSDSDYQQVDKKIVSLKYYPFKPKDKDKNLAAEVKFK